MKHELKFNVSNDAVFGVENIYRKDYVVNYIDLRPSFNGTGFIESAVFSSKLDFEEFVKNLYAKGYKKTTKSKLYDTQIAGKWNNDD